MLKLMVPALGEAWAYRVNLQTLTWLEVKVIDIGKKVRVEFQGSKFEGERRWVPKSRLEVKWHDLPAYADRDRRLKAVHAASNATHAEWEAAEWVLSSVGLLNDAAPNISRDGVLQTSVAGLPPQLADILRVRSVPPSVLDDDGELHVPWQTCRTMVKTAAREHPERIWQQIEKCEREAAQTSVFGHEGAAWMNYGKPFHISGDSDARSFEEKTAPVIAILREWTGSEASGWRQDLVSTRAELSRVADIAQRAIRDLRKLRSNTTAAKLEAELMDPYRAIWPYTAADERRRAANWLSPYVWVLRESTMQASPSDVVALTRHPAD